MACRHGPGWGSIPSRQGGQSLVELAISVFVLMLLLAGAIDFGFLYSQRLEVANAARVGVRWASKHPAAWSSAAMPDDVTIEGQVIFAGDTRNIPNDDSHIQIKYYAVNPTTFALTYCGYYQAAPTAGWYPAPATTYTQATCVVPGSLITVTVNYQYPVLTPYFRSLFGTAITVTSTASMLEEV